MIANQTEKDGADQLVILSGWEKINTLGKLLNDLPYYCKSNGITADTEPEYRQESYFQHLKKRR